MPKLTRRRLLGTVVGASAAAGLQARGPRPGTAGPAPASQTAPPSSAPARGTAPAFFTADELATVTVLSDLIIPADARSGGAVEAGVPAFIDFMMVDQPARQVAMRGGLAWLDSECRRRFDRRFVGCDRAQQTAVLDDIAWPARARPEMSQGVAFFNAFRDLVATGFWTSRMGIDDLQYAGNTFVAEPAGCPPAVLERLGVSYDE